MSDHYEMHNKRDLVTKLFLVCSKAQEYNRVIHKVTLSLSPSLTLYSLFHPQFECVSEVNETGYCFMKMGMSPDDLQQHIPTKALIFDLRKNMSRS